MSAMLKDGEAIYYLMSFLHIVCPQNCMHALCVRLCIHASMHAIMHDLHVSE